MQIKFGRWVENVELLSQIPDVEMKLEYEERFGSLVLTVSKREPPKPPAAEKPAEPEPKKEGA